MKNKIFSLVNQNNQTFMIKANSPEVALIKAQRMGDLGWFIIDELSADEYCYKITKVSLGKSYDELTDDLFRYFKAVMRGLKFDAYMYADCIENILGVREHADLVKYVIDNY